MANIKFNIWIDEKGEKPEYTPYIQFTDDSDNVHMFICASSSHSFEAAKGLGAQFQKTISGSKAWNLKMEDN